MEKEYYLFVQGEKVIVSREVYLAFMRPIWSEKKKAQRKWRCRDAQGVRCKKDCSECEQARLGTGAKGNDISLDRLIECEAQELAGDNDVLDYTIDQFRVDGIRRIISEMKTEDQIIIRKIEEGYNQIEIAEILGVSPAAVNQKLNTIRKKIKKNLRNLNF